MTDPRTVLVSGGAGFIGRKLVARLLRDDHRVVVLDSLEAQVHGTSPAFPPELGGARCIRGDVRDIDAWREALSGVQIVFHLAAATGTAESMYRAHRYVDVNTGGTALLADVLVATPDCQVERVVLASSRAVYGEGSYRCGNCGVVHPAARARAGLERAHWEPQCPRCGAEVLALPHGPTTAVRPTSVYGLTKAQQEDILRAVLGPRGVDVISLRLQNVYGPGQSLANPYVGVLSVFANLLLSGGGVSVFEDGMETRDFLYVDDAVAVFLAAASWDGPATADVGTGAGVPLLDVARALAGVLGLREPHPIRVTGQFRVGDVRHASADTACIEKRLGAWDPVPLPEGLRRFVEWVRSEELPESRLSHALNELDAAGMLGRAAL